MTFREIQKKVNKGRIEIFQNILYLSQNGSLTLEQSNPEHFGDIIITRAEKADL